MSPWLSDLFLGSQSDERLLALASAGHQHAFTAIVERYRRALIAQARRLDAERAEDLVQQTFLCAFSALQDGAEVRHLRGWLYRILRNLASQPSPDSVAGGELDDVQTTSEPADQTAERKMLAFATFAEIARLPPQQHHALIQTAIHGRGRAEVAQLMGVSEGAVRQLVHRARTTLRTAVTAVTPLPLARWFAGSRALQGPVVAQAAVGAGTASAGVAVKLGAVLASGVLATGVVATARQDHGARSGHARVRAAHLEAARGGSPVIGDGPGVPKPRLAMAAGLRSWTRARGASKGGAEHPSNVRRSRGEDHSSSPARDGRDGGSSDGRSSSSSAEGSDHAFSSSGGSEPVSTGNHDGGGSGSDGASTPLATISSDGGSGSGGGSSSGGGSGGSSDGSSTSGTSGDGASSDGGGGSGTGGGDTTSTTATTDSSGG